MSRRLERLWRALAWRLPRALAYWAFIRVAAEATTHEFSDKHPEEVTAVQMMKSWVDR
jgi:hypothetical protein